MPNRTLTPGAGLAIDESVASVATIYLDDPVALVFQFGDGTTADAAGAVRLADVPVGLTPYGWIARADASCSASWTVEDAGAVSASFNDLVGTGTAPALSSSTLAHDTDGTLDWSGGDVAALGALRVTMDSYTPGSSALVTLTLLFTRT